MLERFLAVAKDIFAYVAEVDIEVAAGETFFVGKAGIHQPELDVFDIGCLKVGVVEAAHYTSPVLLRLDEFATVVDTVGGDVVLSALGGVVAEVEHGHTCVLACQHLLVGVDLLLIDDTRAMVGEGFGVGFDMQGCVGLGMTEDGIDGVPVQVRAMAVIVKVIALPCVLIVGADRAVGRVGRCGGKEPVGGIMDVYTRGGGFEVVHIGGARLADLVGMTGDEMGELGSHLDGTGGCGGHPRHLIDGVGEPVHLFLVVEVQSPNHIAERLAAGIDLGGKGCLVHIHDGTSHVEIFAELVL